MLKIGIPKEIKQGETRVGCIPANLSLFHEHEVYIETGAGLASGFSDAQYEACGAQICSTKDVWNTDFIIKVKEPQSEEYHFLDSQIIYGFFHFNSPNNYDLRTALSRTKVIPIPYEEIVRNDSRPCLAPMSAIAGRIAGQKGAWLLENAGILPGGIPGTLKANVVVLGCGISGKNSIDVLLGMGANITAIDLDVNKLDELPLGINTVISSPNAIDRYVSSADLVIGAVLVPGKQVPKLIKADTISPMRPGAGIVDICIDEGGCTELSRPTTHDDPIYNHGGVQFYCVQNMPALVPRNSTPALVNATMKFIPEILGKINYCSDKSFLKSNLPLILKDKL